MTKRQLADSFANLYFDRAKPVIWKTEDFPNLHCGPQENRPKNSPKVPQTRLPPKHHTAPPRHGCRQNTIPPPQTRPLPKYNPAHQTNNEAPQKQNNTPTTPHNPPQKTKSYKEYKQYKQKIVPVIIEAYEDVCINKKMRETYE